MMTERKRDMATIDLHIHSSFSNDADFSPTALVDLCLQAGLTHAAIADHNSVKAIDEALQAAKGTGLEIIPAIEMDCVFDGIVFHLLGYGIDYTNPDFEDIENNIHQQEQDNSARLMHLVRQLGIEFEDDLVERLAFDGVITGEMIAEAALIYDNRANNPLLDPYRNDGERSDNPYVNFYWDYCSQGKPAYVPMDFISLAQAIAMVQSNQGVPVLAHPGLQVKEDLSLLEAVLAEGVVGIEVYSSYHNPGQVRVYQAAARTKRLLITCGSDFHGKTKKNINIGGINCEGQEQRIIAELLEQINTLS
jgi:predicted metal-dependent phosphoesterase TrpH